MPLAVMPNVGLASLAGQRIVFPHATPEYFGEFAAHAQELGARIIGGCCGCTPAEIAAIRRPWTSIGARPRPWSSASERSQRTRASPARARCSQRKLAAREFVVSVEIDPPTRRQPDRRCSTIAQTLKDSGNVDVVDVNDNPRARARMSGIDRVLRDRAARRHRDHPPPDATRLLDRRARVDAARRACRGHQERARGDRRPTRSRGLPGSQGVYDVDSIGLSRIIRRLNAGEDFNGAEIEAPTSFFLGVAVNPDGDDLDYELRRFEQKLEEGASSR